MKILAIETSCDETAIALVDASGGLKRPRFKILKNLVASQIKVHRPFGGVVPSLAKREHIKNLQILFNKILKSKTNSPAGGLKPDIIAVTVGPGLEPALWTGIAFAKEIYRNLRLKTHPPAGGLKPKLIGVNHLEGHLYSFLLSQKTVNSKLFPSIALIVSGGHTILIKMDSLIKYKKIGETRDDAVGEAFDKVARLLGLPYPGGPEIEKLAKKGSPNAIDFPRPMIRQKNYDFSFSGLKTAVLYYLKNQKEDKNLSAASRNFGARRPTSEERFLSDVAASFQIAAFEVLISKTLRAVEEFKAKSIMVSGGVAANKTLSNEFRKALKSQSPTTRLLITKFPGDNAAMIAAAGHLNFLQGKNRRLVAKGDMSL